MRRISIGLLSIALIGAMLWATDWAGPGIHRDGWARGESDLKKDNANGIKLLWKLKVDSRPEGVDSLTAGVIITRQITYRGFKEMLIVAGGPDKLFNVDADLGRLLWKTDFEYHGVRPAASPLCPGAVIAAPAMLMPPMRGGAGRGAAAATPAPDPAPPAPSAVPPPPPPNRGLIGRGVAFLGTLQRIWVVSRDGMLHTVNSHTGADMEAAIPFVPANTRVDSLNIANNVLYATTSKACGGAPNGLYAIDLADDSKTVKSFLTNGAMGLARGGAATATDSTVYVQAIDGSGEIAGQYNHTVLALSPGDLKVKDYFTPTTLPTNNPGNIDLATVTPVVFPYKERELMVAAGNDGRLYLLDSKSLGGPDHKTPLYRTEPFAPSNMNTGGGIWGNFASWEDEATSTRWVYAALWGETIAKIPAPNGPAPHGAIAAFKVVEQNGSPALSLAWISRDMISPAPPVIANGMVLALATGASPRQRRENGTPYTAEDRVKMADRATLYVLDGDTGKELYSSGTAVTSFAPGGLSFANGRAYFGTYDSYLYSFGIPIEH